MKMKKIMKNREHCEALIHEAQRIDAAFAKMISLAKSDKSACKSERAADIALFERERSRAQKMIAWWKSDIERIESAKKSESESAKSESAKSA